MYFNEINLRKKGILLWLTANLSLNLSPDWSESLANVFKALMDSEMLFRNVDMNLSSALSISVPIHFNRMRRTNGIIAKTRSDTHKIVASQQER